MLKTIKRILDLCGSYKSRLIAGIVCSLIYSVCTACSIFAILNILLNIRELTNDHIRNSIWILLVSIVGKCIMKYLISIYMSANGYNVFCEKRMEIGDRMKRAPMGFFSEQNLGMINTALSSATTELENFSMVAVENMVGGIIQAVCVMIVLLFFNWKVALLSLIGLLLSSVTLKLIKIRTTKQAPRREASREIMVTKVLEYIRGISVIRSFGRQPDDEIHQVLEETKNANITMEKQVMSVVNLYKGILEVFSGLIIGYSAWLMLIGQLTFPIGVMFLVAHLKSPVIRQDYRAFFTLLFAQNCRAGPWRQKALPPSLRERAVCSKVPAELLLPWAAAKLLRTSEAEIRVAEQGKAPPSAFGGVCLPAAGRHFTS